MQEQGRGGRSRVEGTLGRAFFFSAINNIINRGNNRSLMNVVHCTKKFIGGRRTKDEGRKRRKKNEKRKKRRKKKAKKKEEKKESRTKEERIIIIISSLIKNYY